MSPVQRSVGRADTDRVTLPLVFRHGAAETVFTIAVLVWLVFEAAGRRRLVPGVW
jgi:hypothetical protein